MIVPPGNNELRSLAEERLKEVQEQNGPALTDNDQKKLVHELRVHQIELEMQNEELQRTKLESEELAEKYIDLYDFAPVGYFTIDPDGTIVSANLTGTALLGKDRRSLIGARLGAFLLPECVPVFNAFCVKVLFSQKKEMCDVDLRGAQEQLPWFAHIEGRAESGDGAGAGRIRLVLTDLSERKQGEQQREQLICELARKNAELDRFTYTVSHDLKSPLLSLRAFLTLLEDDIKSGNTGRVTMDIQRMSESAERLETMITTLLALSRSGRAVDVPVKIPFADLAREAAGMLDVSFQQRSVTLVISDNLPVVMGDRQRLLQVMTNLLDNAAKFMGNQEHRRVEVGVLPGADGPVFFVRDNGMGIKGENLAKVFGLYERFNPEVPGTGIGLAIVQRIIEAHGGRVWAESEGEWKGTTFRFTLPAAG